MGAAVYPRWRGEHFNITKRDHAADGLSPLARGTPASFPKSVTRCRFIPAGAGNTDLNIVRLADTMVYPRWRGEHINVDSRRAYRSGLSPLARGTRPRQGYAVQEIRFIPAGAGNTCSPAYQTGNAPVYPRWRGEHGEYAVWEVNNGGLSPLARGTHSNRCDGKRDRRFIPAGAGNTNSKCANHHANSVYPRWRGEHTEYLPQVMYWSGLSPLARGTRLIVLLIIRRKRFIPAGAGNTRLAHYDFSGVPVYPRWRGEHTKHT